MQRLNRTLWQLADQETALTNAAGANILMRKRRDEQEEVDAYLRARDQIHCSAPPAAGDHGSPIADTL